MPLLFLLLWPLLVVFAVGPVSRELGATPHLNERHEDIPSRSLARNGILQGTILLVNSIMCTAPAQTISVNSNSLSSQRGFHSDRCGAVAIRQDPVAGWFHNDIQDHGRLQVHLCKEYCKTDQTPHV